MSWVESAIWNEALGIMETFVVTLCTWFFLSHTERSIERKAGLRFAMLCLYWAGFTGIIFWVRDNSYINLALPVYMVVMTEAAGCFLYNRGRIYRFYYFLFPLTIVAVQILIGCLVLGYMSARWGTFVFDYYLSNVALIVRQLAEILATGVWAVLLCRRKYEDVRGVWFAGLFLPPMVSAFIIFSLIFIGNVFMQMYGVFLIIVDIFLLVSMNFYIWYLFSYQAKNKKLEAELEIWRKQSEMQYRYYERVEAQYLSSRKMIHDMRNHLQAIEALNDQDAAKGKAYMKDMHQMLDSFGLVSYTDERMLNIILNDKAKAAKELGIGMDIRIGEICLGHVRDMDITTIFGNLLDNALEAAGRAEGERWIQVRADGYHEFAVVRIRNPRCENGAKGTDNETGHMGIGLDNVRHTLEKYGGGMMAESSGDEFTVNLTIPGCVSGSK